MSVEKIITDSASPLVGIPIPSECLLVTDSQRFKCGAYCSKCGKKLKHRRSFRARSKYICINCLT